MSTIAYHATEIANIESIRANGLVPQIGPRSSCIENTPGVYLFKNKEDYQDAMMNWLGDEFSDLDQGQIIVLEVDIAGLALDEKGYELISRERINQTRILRALTEDLEPYLDFKGKGIPENSSVVIAGHVAAKLDDRLEGNKPKPVSKHQDFDLSP